MNYLWSPWRMKYIMNHEPKADCIFCSALMQEDSPENLIIYRGRLSFVILNRFPYTSGHLMVVPIAHFTSIEDLPADTLTELMQLTSKSMQVLREIYNPQGFNIGANIGEAAGAGVASHVHFHIVPRWEGDTNFMTAVSQTRVLPETLEDTYSRILAAWELRISEDTRV